MIGFFKSKDKEQETNLFIQEKKLDLNNAAMVANHSELLKLERLLKALNNLNILCSVGISTVYVEGWGTIDTKTKDINKN